MAKLIRFFGEDILDRDHFTVTLELVPGRESRGRTVDRVIGIAADAYADGRISAVSMTDNPGGNPSLSPDVLSSEIFKFGMDVIVHVTCRDINRAGLESRLLQLARMGMKNILALTGDYSGQGFGGQGAPVFDLDSVSLICMVSMLNRRLINSGDPDEFIVGCAASPFKRTEGECFAQYAKLFKKVAAGAQFCISQLGYDARKFQELRQMQIKMGADIPTLASIYHLTPRIAQHMSRHRIPGAVVTPDLVAAIEKEWGDSRSGRRAAIERTARLAAVIKGLGYSGIHIGGIHSSYDTVGRILDRMDEISHDWAGFIHQFDFPQAGGYYMFKRDEDTRLSGKSPVGLSMEKSSVNKIHFRFMHAMHWMFFDFSSPLAGLFGWICRVLDKWRYGPAVMHLLEDPLKSLMLSCQKCGDCGIQHVAFLCPESQCPKHIRNGACGGSRNGMCEVYPDERRCVWFRAYNRWLTINGLGHLTRDCVPPRMWELNQSSSWMNFHLRRDHQSASTEFMKFCSVISGTIKMDVGKD